MGYIVGASGPLKTRVGHGRRERPVYFLNVGRCPSRLPTHVEVHVRETLDRPASAKVQVMRRSWAHACSQRVRTRRPGNRSLVSDIQGARGGGLALMA